MKPGAAPEFSRAVARDRLPAAGLDLRLAADAAERDALAARFGLLRLDRLEAELHLRKTARGLSCRGTVLAEAVQACVVSGAPVPARLEVSVDLRFEPEEPAAAVEVELGPESLDTLPLADGGADVGEAVAQTLALALDPYPRAGEEHLAEARRHLLTEEEADLLSRKDSSRPFAALGKRPAVPGRG